MTLSLTEVVLDLVYVTRTRQSVRLACACINSSDRTADHARRSFKRNQRTRSIGAMQSAFRLGKTAPSTGSLIFSRQDASRAGLAANTRITLIVQWVVRNVFVCDQTPNVFLRPVGQRTHLSQTEFLVPTHYGRLRSIRALISSDCTSPCIETDSCSSQHI